MRLGIIARCDNTGLGNQTKELVDMLKPDKILLIDAKSFNESEQHYDWYAGYNCLISDGFLKKETMSEFLRDVDVVLTCETFYNNSFISFARKRKIKTIQQYNYEFLEYMVNPDVALPDILLAPSQWNIDKVRSLLGNASRVVYLPPPTSGSTFRDVAKINMSKDHKKILHIAGKVASKDRNGTQTVIDMLKYSTADYELVIRSQTPIETTCTDPRLTISTQNIKNREEMYSGFDAMVLPRRYAGLCLPMNESLLSGLPVFMTDISPNNYILPKSWLIESKIIDKLRTRSVLDVYGADPQLLAKLVDDYINNPNKQSIKRDALSIGNENFDPESIRSQYIELFNSLF